MRHIALEKPFEDLPPIARVRLAYDLAENLADALKSLAASDYTFNYERDYQSIERKHYYIEEMRRYIPLTKDQWDLVIPPVEKNGELAKYKKCAPDSIVLVRGTGEVYRKSPFNTGWSGLDTEPKDQQICCQIQVDIHRTLPPKLELHHGMLIEPERIRFFDVHVVSGSLHRVAEPRTDIYLKDAAQYSEFILDVTEDAIFLSGTKLRDWWCSPSCSILLSATVSRLRAEALVASAERYRERKPRTGPAVNIERPMTPEERFGAMIDELGNG